MWTKTCLHLQDDSGPAIFFFLGCFIELDDRESTLTAANIPEFQGFAELDLGGGSSGFSRRDEGPWDLIF